MYKRNSNIVFGIIIFFSIVQILIALVVIPLPELIKQISIFVYILIVIASSFVLLNLIGKIYAEKPKEKTKIVYKNFKKEKEKTDNTEKKHKDVIKKLSTEALIDLDLIDNHEKFSETLLRNFSKTFNIVQGVVYVKNKDSFVTSNTYAFYKTETAKSFQIGEGITGQVAKNQKFLYIDNVPKNYITVLSGLGDGSPKYLAFIPIISKDKTIAVIEFTMFEKLPNPTENIFNSIAQKLTPLFEKFIN